MKVVAFIGDQASMCSVKTGHKADNMEVRRMSDLKGT